MKCPDSEVLSTYIDQQLPQSQKRNVESHLETCVHCRQRLDELQQLHTILVESGRRRRNQLNQRILRDPCLSVDLFRGYYENRLSPEKKQIVESHLAECDFCLHYYAEMKRTLDMFEQGELQPIPGLAEKIIQTIEQANQLAAAAASDRLEQILETVGLEFIQINPFQLGQSEFYGNLYVRDEESADMAFWKGGQKTPELDGVEITFSAEEAGGHTISRQIINGEVVIDFAELGIAIEDYRQVKYKLILPDDTVLEGRLGRDNR